MTRQEFDLTLNAARWEESHRESRRGALLGCGFSWFLLTAIWVFGPSRGLAAFAYAGATFGLGVGGAMFLLMALGPQAPSAVALSIEEDGVHLFRRSGEVITPWAQGVTKWSLTDSRWYVGFANVAPSDQLVLRERFSRCTSISPEAFDALRDAATRHGLTVVASPAPRGRGIVIHRFVARVDPPRD